MNWNLQDRIKSTIERIESKRRVSKTQHFTRVTESQKYDSFLSTWYKGEVGQIYLCIILPSYIEAEKSKKRNTKKLKVFRP